MTLVRIIKDYEWPLMRQTPGSTGIWNGVQFTTSPTDQCDYTVILNSVAGAETVMCPPEHVWAIMQEPPTEYRKPAHRGTPVYHRIYTPDEDLSGPQYVHSQPALPWHIDRTYDELRHCPVPPKPFRLSCITSNIAVLEGHRLRLGFIKKVREQIDMPLYGRGFNSIPNKWDALAPYRYSLVIENFQNPYYWSEKLADCLLSWTMPIYVGCTQIHTHFPSDAIVSIDMENQYAVEQIREVILSNLWERNIRAIAEARDLVLERHQLFPFLVTEIRKHENALLCQEHKSETIAITKYPGKLQTLVLELSHRLKAGWAHRINVRSRTA
jgi:hypothetical protein